MPVDGGDETQGLPTTSHFEVTAKGLYFFAPGRLAIRRPDNDTGKVSTLATLDEAGNVLTVSPDEAFIV